MEPVSVDGEVVSSTLIRSLIKSGDVGRMSQISRQKL